MLGIFIGSAAILCCGRFHLCRAQSYLDLYPRAIYIFHMMLYVQIFKVYAHGCYFTVRQHALGTEADVQAVFFF